MRWANFKSATDLRDALAKNALPMSVLMNSPAYGPGQTQAQSARPALGLTTPGAPHSMH